MSWGHGVEFGQMIKCPVCAKEVPTDLFMHACHHAARLVRGRGEHLKLAVALYQREYTPVHMEDVDGTNNQGQQGEPGRVGDLSLG